MRAFGVALGKEAKAKDQNGLFAPAFNIARVPECGRNFEYFGEDPYLAGRAAVAVIEGIQSTGTIATAKHFVANNQEDSRRTVSANVGERALREIYLPAFRAAVEEANVGSVMAAYNRVNGTYCTENARLLTKILKDEWGFDGYVISDYGATHSTVPAAKAGLDFEAPARDTQFFGDPLKRAVQSGAVSEATLDGKVRRILGQEAKFGVLAGERVGPPGEANTDAHQQLARRIAADGAVLLKNEVPMKADSVTTEPVLPLDLAEVDTIAVIGPRASEAKTGGGGSSNVTPPPGSSVSPVEGIRERAGSNAAVTTTTGDATADAVALAAASDVAVVVATGSSLEGTDREDLVLDNDQNELIFEVAAANPQTIVVLRTGGPVVMPWLDVVAGVLETWYPGMKDGAATADLLFGEVNPSGKLPITFGTCRAHYPATEDEQYPGVDQGEGYPVAEYSEGVFVGYRHFDAEGTEPLFEFGYGLSYTDFKYSNIEITPTVQPNTETVDVQVSVTVENVGDRAGKEVVQVYVVDDSASIDRPPRELKAFEKTALQPNETAKITFQLDRDAFSFYDVETENWIVESGQFEILVGSSSRDVRQRETLRIVESDK
jgi:beta-glucosidase